MATVARAGEDPELSRRRQRGAQALHRELLELDQVLEYLLVAIAAAAARRGVRLLVEAAHALSRKRGQERRQRFKAVGDRAFSEAPLHIHARPPEARVLP